MQELTAEEKLKYAQEMLESFKMKWFDLDFTVRFNRRCLIANPNQPAEAQVLIKQIESQRDQYRRMIEALEQDITQLKLKPLEGQIKELNKQL